MGSRVFPVVFVVAALFAQAPEAALQRLAGEGDRALAEGRYAEAEQAFTKVRELAPGTAEVYAKLGVIYFQQRKFPEAVQVLRTALKLRPGLPSVDALLAMSLCEQGQFREALPVLEKAFRRSTDPATKRMQGLELERAYTGTRQDAKAVEVALELSRLYPKDPEVLYHAGRLFGIFAYLTMQKLSDVAPDSVWKHLAFGELYENLENHTAAITEYQQVLAIDPQRPGIHFRIGRVILASARRSEARARQTAEAMKEFEQELRIDPANANAAYELGELHLEEGQSEAARGYFEAGLQHYPDFEDAQIALGRTLIALGKPDLALPHLRKAITLNPESDVACYNLARAYGALGDTKEQQQALVRFRTLRAQQTSRQPRDPRREVTKQEIDPAASQQ